MNLKGFIIVENLDPSSFPSKRIMVVRADSESLAHQIFFGASICSLRPEDLRFDARPGKVQVFFKNITLACDPLRGHVM